MNRNEFLKFIKEYANASCLINKNREDLLNKTISEDEASKRIVRYFELDDKLFSFIDSINDEMPKPLKDYLFARKDSACANCWLSSSRATHPECQEKLDRYFNARETLRIFGSLLGEIK